MGLDAMILVFWMLSFKPAFLLSFFTFIKRLFSPSLSAIRAVSSVYLRILIFLPAILIPLVLHPAQRFSWCTLLISRQILNNLNHSHNHQNRSDSESPGKSQRYFYTMLVKSPSANCVHCLRHTSCDISPWLVESRTSFMINTTPIWIIWVIFIYQ